MSKEDNYLQENADNSASILCFGYSDAIEQCCQQWQQVSKSPCTSTASVLQCFLHQVQLFITKLLPTQDNEFCMASVPILAAQNICTTYTLACIAKLFTQYEKQISKALQTLFAATTMHYFVQDWQRFTSSQYGTPTAQDCIMTSDHTAHAILEHKVKLHKQHYIFVNATPQQRNERRNWIRLFAASQAVMYFLDLLSLFETLQDDSNALQENLQMIDELCHSRYFIKVPVLVVVIHQFQFLQRVTHTAMQRVFPSYSANDDPVQFICKHIEENDKSRYKHTHVHICDPHDAKSCDKLAEHIINFILKNTIEVQIAQPQI